MLANDRRYPRLVEGVKLVHPEGTDQYFMYNSEAGDRYELNEVAFEMLKKMNGSHDIEEICRVIQAGFEEADSVHEDLEALIKKVAAEGYVELTHHCGRD